MDTQELRQLIIKELPALMQSNEAFRATILDISRAEFADKTETESRLNLMMATHEQSMAKWDEHHRALIKLTKSVDNLEQRLEQKIAEDRQNREESHKQMIALTSTIQNLALKSESRRESPQMGRKPTTFGRESTAMDGKTRRGPPKVGRKPTAMARKPKKSKKF